MIFSSIAIWFVTQAWHDIQCSSSKKQSGRTTPDLEKPSAVAIKHGARLPTPLVPQRKAKSPKVHLQSPYSFLTLPNIKTDSTAQAASSSSSAPTYPIDDIAKEPYVPGRLASNVRSWGADVSKYRGKERYGDVLLEYLDRKHQEQSTRGLDFWREDDVRTYPY